MTTASPQFLKLVQRLRERPRVEPVDVVRLRRGMEAVAFPVAADVTVTATSVAGTPAEWLAAPGADDRVLLYVHGGGFVMGSPSTHRKLAGDLARAAGIRVLLLDYPLAPEHLFPAAIHAVVAAYRALRATVLAERIVLAGDSAGAAHDRRASRAP
jgi:acetyl esterase/lipase